MAAFYLKYRPQSLEDLVGQDPVKKILSSSYKENKLSHAYLFAGPRGTGKTSTARILAKMVNCESVDGQPCNKCTTCISITDGSNLDLIEIDAASNRGIEDIRLLREKIKLAPTSAKKKVYIIDEVHMLTTEAFNALLKTLEEPPEHALFILATTDAQKLPQTILSRVTRLDFKYANQLELLEALKKIVAAEKINIDEEGLKLLVKKSDGSFRDGVKLLDQVSSLGGKITAKVIAEHLKSGNFDDLLEFLQSLANKDAKNCLVKISGQVEKGIDIKELMLALMGEFRNLMLIKNGLGENLVKSHLKEEEYQSLFELAEKYNDRELIRNLDILQKNLEKLKVVSIPSLPLEVAVVEICGGSGYPENSVSQIESDKFETRKVSEPADQREEVFDTPITSDSSDISKIKEKWTFVLETIRPYNFSLEALLRSINIAECTNELVIMEVPYSFHQRILEAPKNRDLLESILSDILGRQIKVSTKLGSRPQRKEDIANIEVAADDEIIRVAAEIFNSDSIN